MAECRRCRAEKWGLLSQVLDIGIVVMDWSAVWVFRADSLSPVWLGIRSFGRSVWRPLRASISALKLD